MNYLHAVGGSGRIDLAATPDFDLGGVRIRPSIRRIDGAGETRVLEPRVMQVLVALASARPEVVARDRLIELCWDGRIVGEDALNRCVLALRNIARSIAPPPFSIETVPRVGHRLIERSGDGAAFEATPVAAAPRRRRPAAKIILIALAVIGVAIALIWFGQSRADRPAPASIAVLPFRNLSPDNPYFAEGVGEEVLGQLSREPEFRVIGRTSAAKFRDADLREAGRALNVAYILEGSVRTGDDRVRVNAALVQARDGVRLWSETYDRKLDDIFAIQNAIGASVAGSLKRTLFKSAPLAGPLTTDGETYALYLRARGLLRARESELARPAVDMLRQAIRRDPGYAPAWSSLALGLRLRANGGGMEAVVAATPQAEAFARRALRLAPDLAEAHGVLGMLLGFASPAAQWHIRRAAALDPNSAENMFWLGNTESTAYHFPEALAAFKRAAAIDPLWFRPASEVAMTIANMGHRKEAEAIATRSFASEPATREMLLGHIALALGDISGAARHWAMVAKTDSALRDLAKIALDQATFSVGLSGPSRDKSYIWDFGRSAIITLPPPDDWRARNRDATVAEIFVDQNHAAAKLMLSAGRYRELLATYDSAAGLFGIQPARPFVILNVRFAPVVALALRRGGRTAEADRLLARSDAALRAIYRRGPVPFRIDAEAAALNSVRGRTDPALSMLERALARGWTHSSPDDLLRIADEPAFAALRGNPRFRAIEARLGAWREREKRETAALRL